MEIGIKNLDYSYNNNLVLEKINFEINYGETIAIVGPNGAGKSTLMKCLVNDLTINEGEILFDNINVSQFSQWEKIGYVKQNINITSAGFPISVREFLLTFDKKESIENLEKLAGKLGISTLLDKNLNKLSGGEQKRVFIARALENKPSVIILDEPYTAVDQKSKNEINDLLLKLKEENITIILVTHNLGQITSIVDKVCVLNQRVEFFGSLDNYLDKYGFGK